MQSLRRSLEIQGRVLWALMLREVITRFGRHNLGALWLVAEPMIFTLGVAGVWTAAGLRHGAGIPMVAFAITGYSSVLMWRNSVSHCSHAIHHNISLLFHRNVKSIDVLLTRIALEVAGATGSFAVLTVFFASIEWITLPVDPLQVIGGWLMLSWFATGLALTVGSASAFSPVVERIWHPTAYLLFPLSGAAYMSDWLPLPLRSALLWLPMVHAVEFIREGYFGPVVHFHYDMAYMAICNSVLTLSGLALVRLADARIEAE
jgi:capsular polysaccharide transport system permease protein